jgi:hypothetical protein
MDGMQMEREGTRVSISPRRMSFNPVSDWVPEPSKKPSEVATYTREEVSKGKRMGKPAARNTIPCLPLGKYLHSAVQVTVAVIYCLFATGIVFGYAAIKPVLIREGVYKNQCTKKELKDQIVPCYGQEIRFV